MAKRMALTPASIDDLESGRICDAKTPGLRIEAFPSGKKRWKYRRRLAGRKEAIKLSFGLFPTYSIAEARAWARNLNEELEAGIDPREMRSRDDERSAMTVARAHALYMSDAKSVQNRANDLGLISR